jgi:hypothetical protein
MIYSIITGVLTRVALRRLSELDLNEAGAAAAALRQIAKSVRKRSPLGTLGVLAAGLAVGAGVGMVLAPESGAKTRAAIRAAVGQRFERLRSRFARSKESEGRVPADEAGVQASAPFRKRGNGATSS